MPSSSVRLHSADPIDLKLKCFSPSLREFEIDSLLSIFIRASIMEEGGGEGGMEEYTWLLGWDDIIIFSMT